MIKRFQHFDHVDIPTMQGLINAMMEVLELLDEGEIPNSDYDIHDLENYLESLVKGQRGSLGRTKSGSWGVVPNDAGMDSDARVDFIFRPTYIAVATLGRALCEVPLLAIAIPGYAEALRSGMQFCSYRNLRGSGYEADEGAIDALRTLSLGKVPWLLHRNPEASPELKEAIEQVAEDMAHRLEHRSAVGVWGEDFSEGFRSAIETLRLKNDPEFMKALGEAKRNPDAAPRSDLPW